MAINPLQQRLIAAGAQPERAQGFVEQAIFNKGPQLATFKGAPKVSGGIKPIVLGDPYDDKTTQARKDYFPNLYYPPEPESQDFKPYFDVVLGKGAYDNFFNKSIAQNAKKFRTATYSAAQLDRDVTKMIKEGYGLDKIEQYLRSDAATQAGSLKAYTDAAGQKNIIASVTPDQAMFRATELYADYESAKDNVNEYLVKQITKNKAYQFGLPDPKLRYGMTTDLSKGTIAITFQPAVANALAKYKKDPSFASKQNRFLIKALKAINEAKLTPFTDAKKLGEKFRGKRP